MRDKTVAGGLCAHQSVPQKDSAAEARRRRVRGVISSLAGLDRKLLFARSGRAASTVRPRWPSRTRVYASKILKMVHDKANRGLCLIESTVFPNKSSGSM